MDVVLALNTGGTSTRLALTDRENRILRRVEPDVETDVTDYHAWVATVTRAVRDLIGNDRLVSIGAGIAGNVEDGVIVDSGNLQDFNGQDIRADLAEAFNAPAVILNDAQAEALGEYEAYRIPLIFLGWGTGIGVAIVIMQDDGTPLVIATELGHMTIMHSTVTRTDYREYFQCGCGGYGHLEALTGGAHLARRFAATHASKLMEWQWQQVLTDVATGCVNLALFSKGAPVVLGGGIAYKQLAPAPSGKNRLPALQKLVNERKTTVAPPKLLLARHGEDSGLVGASYAAWRLAD